MYALENNSCPRVTKYGRVKMYLISYFKPKTNTPGSDKVCLWKVTLYLAFRQLKGGSYNFLSSSWNLADKLLLLFQVSINLSPFLGNRLFIASKFFYRCLLPVCKVSRCLTFHSSVCKFSKLVNIKKKFLGLGNFGQVPLSQLLLVFREIFTAA